MTMSGKTRKSGNFELFERAYDAILILEPEGGEILAANPRACEIYGYPRDELVGLSIAAFTNVEKASARLAEIVEKGEMPPFETTHRRKDGIEMRIEIHASVVTYKDHPAILSINRDVTERVEAQKELAQSLALFRATLESTADGILVVDLNGDLLAWNHKFQQMWRLPESILAERSGSRWIEHAMSQVDDVDQFTSRLLEVSRRPDAESHDEIRMRDGRIFERFSLPQRIAGKSAGRVWSYRDITDQRRAEEEIRHRAYHDNLTGLPNRMLFKDHLELALAQARRSRTPLAILFLDLDRFKNINDTLGHAAGDLLLKEVATRLEQRCRGADTVARLGGDEFIMLAQSLRVAEDAAKVAEGVLDVLRPTVDVNGHELGITTSIGISVFPGDGDDVDTLIKHADVAMYRAKDKGRNHYQIYQPEMNARAMELLLIEQNLRQAIEREEFVVHYQPKVDAVTGAILSTEALVRWQRDGSMVPPGDFISTAENTGQIVEIGEWVLRTACLQARRWQRDGHPSLGLAVNLSPLQLHRRNFLDMVRQVLDETAFDPTLLELELTENALMNDTEAAIATLKRLREMGIRIALDDFGTGHSSLAKLKGLPITIVKVDRGFVRDCTDPRDGAIVRAIVDMAHSLDLRVVAEGVETPEQAKVMRYYGCEELQGYYFSRPVEAEALAHLLSARALPAPPIKASPEPAAQLA